MHRCVYCNFEIDLRTAYRKVTGWERKAVGSTRKGGSDITLRAYVDEFACPACITLLRSGIHMEQGALL